MNSKEIRSTFLKFFESKGHKVVPSAPIVVKDDPTLMFTNAGMNQFKDYFLGDKKASFTRAVDTQKCLRVSGKHNDLEEVGRDSYHHTMFEMLGNWSFGDYFKEEAIEWAWELLTKEYNLDPNRLYVSVFAGDPYDGLGKDSEAANLWRKFVPEERILYFDKQDNFWEMGDIGPCGPCSEIHIDLRSDEARKAKSGGELVNMDNPLVIEIWNLVFIQFNRKADGTLEELPEKHVDTGMGFERLAMAIQGKKSNYDSDVFRPMIELIEKKSGISYTGNYEEGAKTDIAMRVIADHVRAVSFTIADGELPSNTGAGYVIRRILRRAVRYYYSFLNIKEAFIYQLVASLAKYFEDIFPELEAQSSFVSKVIQEEEKSFLKTLAGGLKRIESINVDHNLLDGKLAFELFDTYGFPIDLTRLIASEKSWNIDESGFEKALEAQQARGRADAQRNTGDWNKVFDGEEVTFVGYDHEEMKEARVLKYREVEVKKKKIIQLVLDKTAFYAEGGGQVGDVGVLMFDQEQIKVVNTVKENNLIIHLIEKLPQYINAKVNGFIDTNRRKLIENNHSATHLMHAALRKVLGIHVHQKGSLVKEDYLRFDFSHFSKMSEEEINAVEQLVNQKIRENIVLEEHRSIPVQQAKDAGAMMLFGEKYGDHVRMITYDETYSRELCGGCHVSATGKIGYFKITSESAIAAGVRRIEAITADASEHFINEELNTLKNLRGLFKSPKPIVSLVEALQAENKELQKTIDAQNQQKAVSIQTKLLEKMEVYNGINLITEKLDFDDNKLIKTMIHNIAKSLSSSVILIGFIKNGKPQLMLHVDPELVAQKALNAGSLIRTLAKKIKGGGGGQAHFATAGGSDNKALQNAIDSIKELL